MMIIRRSTRFLRDYKKLPQRIQRQTDEKLRILLSNNIDYPSLRIKRVKKYKGLLELSVTMQYRLLFRIEGDIYYLSRVGKHDEILK